MPESSDASTPKSRDFDAPLQDREALLFDALSADYGVLLQAYLRRGGLSLAPKRRLMQEIVATLGGSRAKPRDLIDLHVAALDRALEGEREVRAVVMVAEGRLAVLEMMGLLADYYRTSRPKVLTA